MFWLLKSVHMLKKLLCLHYLFEVKESLIRQFLWNGRWRLANPRIYWSWLFRVKGKWILWGRSCLISCCLAKIWVRLERHALQAILNLRQIALAFSYSMLSLREISAMVLAPSMTTIWIRISLFLPSMRLYCRLCWLNDSLLIFDLVMVPSEEGLWYFLHSLCVWDSVERLISIQRL